VIANDLPELVNAIQGMWPRLEITRETNASFVGFKRRVGGYFVAGIFTPFSVDEVIDACREWSVENPGGVPTWNQGRGWREIRLALRQRLNTPGGGKSDLELHREHYAAWPDWKYPGDAIILACIHDRRLTPLQKHVFAELGKIRHSLCGAVGAAAG
jgi:hypothetical protein